VTSVIGGISHQPRSQSRKVALPEKPIPGVVRMPLANKSVVSQIHQSQIRHQSCPSLNNAPTHAAGVLGLPKSCPTSATVSPNSSQQLLLPLNSASKSGLGPPASTKNQALLLQPVSRHSLHPQLGVKEKIPSSSFSTRVVVSRTSSSSVLSKKSNDNKPAEVMGPNYENAGPGRSNKTEQEVATVMKEPAGLAVLNDHMQSDSESEVTPYENLNMDYITRLTSEGYSQELVIRALGISRNDIEMARDILHEFATRAS